MKRARKCLGGPCVAALGTTRLATAFSVTFADLLDALPAIVFTTGLQSLRSRRGPVGLRFLRRCFARTVEGNRLANERLEGRRVNLFSFVDVDRAAYVSVKTRVEEARRILQ